MPKFTVTVERITHTTHTIDLSIEAASEGDAIEKAVVEAENGAIPEHGWDFEDEDFDYDVRDVSSDCPEPVEDKINPAPGFVDEE
jgi:hypothetical protein